MAVRLYAVSKQWTTQLKQKYCFGHKTGGIRFRRGNRAVGIVVKGKIERQSLSTTVVQHKTVNVLRTFRWDLALAHEVGLVGDENNDIRGAAPDVGSSDVIIGDVTARLCDVINERVRPLVAGSISHRVDYDVRVGLLDHVVFLSQDIPGWELTPVSSQLTDSAPSPLISKG